jgi:hypothetical protein
MRRISRATTERAAPAAVVASRRDAMANDFGIGQYCSATERRLMIPIAQRAISRSAVSPAPLISLAKIGVEALSCKRGLRAPRRCARCPGGLGLVLAAIALLLQVAVPILHSPVLVGSTEPAGDLATGFDEHALCLAQGRGDPGSGTPADRAPHPGDHDLAACCFWHGSTTLALVPPTIIERVAFARSGIAFTSSTEVARPRRAGTTRARAPPVRA